MKRRIARKMLRGEVEKCELAETSLIRIIGVTRAGDRSGGEEILAGEVECNLRVGTVGHLHIEDDVAAAKAEVADASRVAVRLLGHTQRDGVRNLAPVLIKPQILQRRSRVRKYLRINDSTALAGVAGDGDRPLIAQVLRIGTHGYRSRRCLPEQEREQQGRLHLSGPS